MKSYNNLGTSILTFLGVPKTWQILKISSTSLVPGKSGLSVYSSAIILPTAHTSMGELQAEDLNKTSGARYLCKENTKSNRPFWVSSLRWRGRRLSFCLVVHFSQGPGVKCLSVLGFYGMEQMFPDHKLIAELETNIMKCPCDLRQGLLQTDVKMLYNILRKGGKL